MPETYNFFGLIPQSRVFFFCFLLSYSFFNLQLGIWGSPPHFKQQIADHAKENLRPWSDSWVFSIFKKKGLFPKWIEYAELQLFWPQGRLKCFFIRVTGTAGQRPYHRNLNLPQSWLREWEWPQAGWGGHLFVCSNIFSELLACVN